MKNKKCIILNLWIFFLISPFMVMAQMPQIETLDRGIVAVNMSKKEGQKKNGIFLSWRFLDSDDKTTAFNVYRDGKLLTETPLTTVTNYTDTEGTTSSEYVIETLVGGKVTKRDTVKEIWPNIYKQIPLDRPKPGITPPYSVTLKIILMGNFIPTRPTIAAWAMSMATESMKSSLSGIRPIHVIIPNGVTQGKSTLTVTNSMDRNSGVSISEKTYGPVRITPNLWCMTSMETVRPKWPVKRPRARLMEKEITY